MDCEVHKLFGEDGIYIILIIYLNITLASVSDPLKSTQAYMNVLCSNQVVPGMGWTLLFCLCYRHDVIIHGRGEQAKSLKSG